MSLQQLVDRTLDRAAMDTRIAITVAEYILRRAAVDSSRTLGAGRSAFAQLTAGAASGQGPASLGSATPFRDKAGRVAKALPGGAAAVEGSAVEEEGLAPLFSSVNATKELLVELFTAVAEAADKQAEENTTTTTGDPISVDWGRFERRARNLGGALGEDARQTVRLVRADFEAFSELRDQGVIPPLDGGGRLKGFGRSRAEQARRASSDVKRAGTSFAAAVGGRAVKDASDTLVYGALPPAKVAGRVLAQKVAASIAERLKPSNAEAEGSDGPSGMEAIRADLSSVWSCGCACRREGCSCARRPPRRLAWRPSLCATW